ncbi:UNVERIFIED_ORG: hypothetical protein FHR35_004064 [Microbispora rosea subsp. rosea]
MSCRRRPSSPYRTLAATRTVNDPPSISISGGSASSEISAPGESAM